MKFIKKNWKKITVCISIILLILFVYFFENISEFLFADTNKYRGELIKAVSPIIMAIVAILTWLNNSKNNLKTKEKQIVEQTSFNSAVKHLGNENQSVVLGGIHALHQIAVDNKNYTQVVHNLFCSYLRENSAKLYENIDFEKTPDKCSVIIQTLIDYLFRPYNNKDSVYKEYKSDLSFSTFKNCDFNSIDVKNVIFDYCLLETCNFNNSCLTSCNFLKGTLTDCKFIDGSLTVCDFNSGKLTDCIFNSGTLTECSFYVCTLTKCIFNSTTLTNCNFILGILTDCKFIDGSLTVCNFSSGILTKCNFEKGTLNDCNFKNTKLINTELPPN